jgi:hypothetical protein
MNQVPLFFAMQRVNISDRFRAKHFETLMHEVDGYENVCADLRRLRCRNAGQTLQSTRSQ